MLTHVRRRRILVAALAGAALAALGITVTSSHAGPTALAAGLPDLLKSTPESNQAAQLKAGLTYQASLFPIPLRLAAHGGVWWGHQYRTSQGAKPRFGWVQVAHPGVKGQITIVTAYGPTPSVAATIARLRVGGSHLPETNVGGTEFGKPSPVRVAGYSGEQFDGDVWGIYGHGFIPFTPKTRGASPTDDWHLDKGESFRIIALDVRGKTVVAFLESAELPADRFPAFLDSAGAFLESLTFPPT
jgi:hypothetical protein